MARADLLKAWTSLLAATFPARAVYGGPSTIKASDGAGTIRTRETYPFSSRLLPKSEMPATIAETVFVTSDAEAKLLASGTSDGTGARQQQIAGKSKVEMEDHLATH